MPVSPVLEEAPPGRCGLHPEPTTVLAGDLDGRRRFSYATQFVSIEPISCVDPPFLPVMKSDTGTKLVLTR